MHALDTVPFHDLVSGEPCALVIGRDTVGVEHPECTYLADVSVNLDAFYCTKCGANGRVSGAWVVGACKLVRGE